MALAKGCLQDLELEVPIYLPPPVADLWEWSRVVFSKEGEASLEVTHDAQV